MIEPSADAAKTTTMGAGRWTLMRDVAVFQVKLIVDGLRDVILVPLSLVAGIASLVGGKDGYCGPQFYQLLQAGRRSESWINLFAAYSGRSVDANAPAHFSVADIDAFVARVEAIVVDEYRRGGMTVQAKATVDRALEAIQSVVRPNR